MAWMPESAVSPGDLTVEHVRWLIAEVERLRAENDKLRVECAAKEGK